MADWCWELQEIALQIWRVCARRATASHCGRETDLQCCLHLQTQTWTSLAATRHVTLTPVRNPMTPERLPTSYTFHVLIVISKLVVINLHRAQLPVGKSRHDIMIIIRVLGLITWNHWADFTSWSSYKQGRNIKRLPRRKHVSFTKSRGIWVKITWWQFKCRSCCAVQGWWRVINP